MRFRKTISSLGVFLAIFSYVFSLSAFLPPKDTAGPLTLSIAYPGEVTTLGQALRINLTVANAGPAKVKGTVRLGVVDDWRVEDSGAKPFSLEANSTQSLSFNVIPGKGSYAALYPIHAWAEFRDGSANLTAHAILIASVSPSAVIAARPATAQFPVLKLSKNGQLRLDEPGVFCPSIAILGLNPVAKPIGWQGSDEATGAVVQLLDIARGDRRHALSVHPAWRKEWGDVFVDYRVMLPDQKPISLDFATALRI